jgi:hypothetical protein
LRRIPLSRRSHIIGFQPLATGIADHESLLERDFVTLTSFLHPSASITAQPVTLSFRDGAKARRYTPDFLVSGLLTSSELVEVKYQADLKTQWRRLDPAFAAARTWAREHDAMFLIATEHDIRGPRLENAKRLLPLRRAPLDAEMAERVLAASRSLDEPTFGAVLAALPASRRCVVLATLWRLIAQGALHVDYSAPITLDTPILKI